MKATGYKNPEGLTEPGHTTTARDLSILATRLMHDFPDYVPYYAIKKYHYEGTPAANDSNRNTLLFRDPSVDDFQKTGRTDAAGYCLIATAKRDFPIWVHPVLPPARPLRWAAVDCCPLYRELPVKMPEPMSPRSS